MNFNHSFGDFEYFCPACNLTFRSFVEYQSHYIIKAQQQPYNDEIKETVRFMKEVVENIPHKAKSNTTISPDIANKTSKPAEVVRANSRRSKFKIIASNMNEKLNETIFVIWLLSSSQILCLRMKF